MHAWLTTKSSRRISSETRLGDSWRPRTSCRWRPLQTTDGRGRAHVPHACFSPRGNDGGARADSTCGSARRRRLFAPRQVDFTRALIFDADYPPRASRSSRLASVYPPPFPRRLALIARGHGHFLPPPLPLAGAHSRVTYYCWRRLRKKNPLFRRPFSPEECPPGRHESPAETLRRNLPTRARPLDAPRRRAVARHRPSVRVNIFIPYGSETVTRTTERFFRENGFHVILRVLFTRLSNVK